MNTKQKLISGGALTITGAITTYINGNLNNPTYGDLFLLFLCVSVLSYGLAFLSSNEKYTLNASRIFVGILFIFSGWVKAVDPLGANYKFIDYFDAWNMSFMNPAAFALSVIQNTIEFVVGIALLLNLLTKQASLIALLFMVYYTPITFYLAIQEHITGKEVVHDCGCFGDALVITNWQTFYKNFVLLVPTVFTFIKRKEYSSLFDCKKQIAGVSAGTVAILIITFYGYLHLPIQDFRPYKVGTNIPESMIVPEGAPQHVYMTYFQYKNLKTGVIKEFDQNNLPYEDTETWEYVADQEPKTELLQRGYEPPINNFTISNNEEGDITEEVLADPNYSFLIVAYDLSKTDIDGMKNIIALKKYAEAENIAFRVLTSSINEDIDTFVKACGENFNFFNTDPVTLKTIVRANPGIVLLKQGNIINKWHHNDCPSIEEIKVLTK